VPNFAPIGRTGGPGTRQRDTRGPTPDTIGEIQDTVSEFQGTIGEI
jgi:hypothetical protein